MKRIITDMRKLITFCIMLIPLSCATGGQKEIVTTGQDLEKMKPVAIETAETSYITGLLPEMLEDRSTIRVNATGPIHYTAFKLTDPLRLMLDIPDMQPKPELQYPIQFDQGAINSISTQYFAESNITRIIIGLNQNVHYDIVRTGENALKVDVDLPKGMQEEADVRATQSELPEEEANPETNTLSAEAAVKQLSETEQEETLLEEPGVDESVETEGAKEGLAKKKKYTGRLISLDFQDADLKSALRFIADSGVIGLNIIISPEVKGTVNLRLIKVPWDQALDLILKNNELGMEKEGSILRIATLKKLAEEKQAEIDVEKMKLESKKTKEKSEKLAFSTIRISYANLTELKGILDGIKSERGDIKVDERTKTMILHDIKSKISEMQELVKILDERTPQVTIEARIVEVSTNYARELGIQWGGSLSKTTSKEFPNTIRLKGGIVPPTSVEGSLQTSGSNYLVDLPAAVGVGKGGALGLSLGSLTGAALLDIQLSALEDSGHGKILSSPKITTANHIQATIKSGRRIPYETISAEGTQTQFIDAAISLKVTPHIAPDGYIHLEIEATKNEADFGQTGASGAPTILTKEAKTEVLIKNGDTTVIGGLYKRTKSKANSGIPFFSTIPVLGWLFKNELKRVETEELLIFITPTLVEG